ncbi:MAG: UDP-3-O-(3-hydroxymyristoyl)glucosamine N-acyltransferase [bacterium]
MNIKPLDHLLSVDKLLDVVKGELIGRPTVTHIKGIASLDRAEPNDVSFYTGPKYADQLKQTKAAIVLVSELPHVETTKVLVKVKNIHLSLAYLLSIFYPTVLPSAGIHPTAAIDESAVIDETCFIDANVVIKKGVRIGSNSALFAGVYVGENTVIGSDCIIYPNVTIYHQVSIGKRVVIHGGAVIGSDGFGFARDGDTYVKIPHIGGVDIKDDVEIGANSTIDRGSIAMTVIEQGVKIDNLVHLAHNVSIGKDSAIAAQVGIAGSTKIGRNVTLGGQAGVSGHVKIGENVTVTSRGTIMKNTPSNQIVSGFPQMPHQEWKRNQVALRQASKWMDMIKEMAEKIRKLESDMTDLKGKDIIGD